MSFRATPSHRDDAADNQTTYDPHMRGLCISLIEFHLSQPWRKGCQEKMAVIYYGQS
jgi:hypothetical protein